MGRKSKSRGKSKRGGKQQQRSPGTAKRSPDANAAKKTSKDLMQLFEESLDIIRGGNTMENKAGRDEYEEKLKSLNPEDFEG